ncbi:MAG: helicase-related protein [Solirubrobacteraceae bacterium]
MDASPGLGHDSRERQAGATDGRRLTIEGHSDGACGAPLGEGRLWLSRAAHGPFLSVHAAHQGSAAHAFHTRDAEPVHTGALVARLLQERAQRALRPQLSALRQNPHLVPRIFDNIEQSLLPGIKELLPDANRLDACVGYFNLRGWRTLCTELDAWAASERPVPHARVLIGMQGRPQDDLRDLMTPHEDTFVMDNATAHRLKTEVATELRSQLTVGVPTNADEAALRGLARQLRERRVEVRVFLRHRLHAKLYLCHRDDVAAPIVGFVGSSNLTFSGLKGQGELNVDVVESDAAKKLSKWFNDRWQDRFTVDISDELASIIDESWARELPLSPYLVYIKMAYHLSREARAGLTEFSVPAEFDGLLLDFQEAALRIAARHLHRRGGVLIGDVVGLGKTMTGSALAKLYQDDFGAETLILCPKNLETMWQGYVDRFRLLAKVLPLSQARQALPELRRFRLVLIDESHNLRNREGKTYEVVRNYIEANGAKCILLSATPYNKDFEDLASQLRLFIGEEQDLGIRPERLLADVGEIEFLRLADGRPTSIRAFEASSHADDWRDLMRLYMVRRTRTFIRLNYAETDGDGREYLRFPDGRRSYFPTRVPVPVQPKLRGKDDQYGLLFSDDVVNVIDRLKLPRYGLAQYVQNDIALSTAEQDIVDGLSRAGTRLVGFTRTGLFKRLESSGAVFLKSVERHVLRNFMYLHALENGLDVPIGPQPTSLFADTDAAPEDLLDDPADQTAVEVGGSDAAALRVRAALLVGELRSAGSRQVRWLRSDVFDGRLAEDLLADAEALLGVLAEFGSWDSAKDVKVDALTNILLKQHAGEKVVVFTEYADTAAYLEQALGERGVSELAMVTGDHEDPTAIVRRFSPRSNAELGEPQGPPVRVLVATDVLSEGQNLQDAAIVVSYDLPWAIIRLVQRAGRVDRLGQESDEIRIYSFLPADGLETILNLRARVRRRLQENAEVVGADEEFFDVEKQKRVLQGLYDESNDALDEDAQDVDLASYAFQIYKNAIDAQPELDATITTLPDVVHATRATDGAEGVLVFTSTTSGIDHLVRLRADGSLISESPLEILQAAACAPDTVGLQRRDDHHALVERAVRRAAEAGPVRPEGALSGVRRRIYVLLLEWGEQTRGTLFRPPELDEVLSAIYAYPLREHAKDVIVKNIRAGKEPKELADLCVRLHHEGNLVLGASDDWHEEVQIVCSMGLDS